MDYHGVFSFFERTGDAIDVVVAALVAYEYGCKGDVVSVPQNVNIQLYQRFRALKSFILGVFCLFVNCSE